MVETWLSRVAHRLIADRKIQTVDEVLILYYDVSVMIRDGTLDQNISAYISAYYINDPWKVRPVACAVAVILALFCVLHIIDKNM